MCCLDTSLNFTLLYEIGSLSINDLLKRQAGQRLSKCWASRQAKPRHYIIVFEKLLHYYDTGRNKVLWSFLRTCICQKLMMWSNERWLIMFSSVLFISRILIGRRLSCVFSFKIILYPQILDANKVYLNL